MINKYENMLLAGGLNVDLIDSNNHHTNHLSDLLDCFKLVNLVKKATCFESRIKSD